MKNYIGTKLVKATPMNRQEYNDYRGWELPDDEDGADEGFLVEYTDGGQSNHKDHEGYISWSPSNVFETSYQEVTNGVTFSKAIELLKLGKKVGRVGWNGKGMWLKLIHPYYNDEYTLIELQGMEVGTFAPYVGMNTADNQFVPWLCSQTDLLAEDWELVN